MSENTEKEGETNRFLDELIMRRESEERRRICFALKIKKDLFLGLVVLFIHGINTDSYPTVYIMDPEVGFSSAQKGTNYFYVSSNVTGLSLSGYLSKR